MARRWTFGTDSFGSLSTDVAPHLLDSGQLQVAENVSREIAGAITPTKTDLELFWSPDGGADGLRGLRYGGTSHILSAGPEYLYEDGVQIGAWGDSGPDALNRFLTDSDRAYALNGKNNRVWDGATMRSLGPFGSDLSDTGYDSELMMVTNDDSTAAGLTGAYLWAASYRVTLESGVVIESKLYPLFVNAGTEPEDNYLGSITLTSSDGVMLTMRKITQAEVDAWCADLGTGKVEGVFWRTKSAGTDYWEHSVVAESDIIGVIGAYSKHDEATPDDALGALYLDADDAHSNPPENANLGVFCQRRLFLAAKGSRTLYFSGIDQYDYFPPTNSVDCEESIEALSTIGNDVAVVTPTSIRLWSPVDETGQWSNTSSSVGTLYADSVVMTDRGLMFCRDDGVYLFNGVSSDMISDTFDPAWTPGTWVAAYCNGRAYFTNGFVSLEFEIIKGTTLWSTATVLTQPGNYTLLSDDASDGFILGMTTSGRVFRIHGGSARNTAISKTKDYGDGNVRHWDRLIADFEGTLSAVVTTNRGATQPVYLTSTDRLQIRAMLEASVIGELANVTFTGTGTAYRVELETT